MIDRCQACAFDWALTSDAAIRAITNLPDQFQRLLAEVGREDGEAVRQRPTPGVWSAVEYAAHVGDMLAFYDHRIARVLRENRPRLVAPPGGLGALVDEGDHRSREVAHVIDDLRDKATALTARLVGLGASAWVRIGLGSQGGERTVLDLVRRAAHDGHHHCRDIEHLHLGR